MRFVPARLSVVTAAQYTATSSIYNRTVNTENIFSNIRVLSTPNSCPKVRHHKSMVPCGMCISKQYTKTFISLELRFSRPHVRTELFSRKWGHDRSPVVLGQRTRCKWGRRVSARHTTSFQRTWERVTRRAVIVFALKLVAGNTQ